MTVRRWAALAAATVLMLIVIPVAAAPPLPREKLPPVTVRWEDAAQREVFVVEGARYRCRVATHPARILSLEVGGRSLLGPGGVALSVTDGEGRRYVVPPRAYVPKWDVWRRTWTPARDGRARMNVWNAAPYYWDAHLLEIPFVREDVLKAAAAAQVIPGKPRAEFDFVRQGASGWEAAQDARVSRDPQDGHLTVRMAGRDPQIQSPPLDVNTTASLNVVVRMRTRENGDGILYWADGNGGYAAEQRAEFAVVADGEWHEYRVPLPSGAIRLRRLRLDPPGTSGTADIAFVRVEEVAKRSDAPVPIVRGELIFHAYPDQLRIEFRADTLPGGPSALRDVTLSGDELPAGKGIVAGGRPLAADAAFALLGPASATITARDWSAPLTGKRPGAVWVLRPLAAGETPAAAFSEDLSPLADSAVTVEGGRWLGYDPASGLYRMEAHAAEPGAFGFEAAYMNPDRRLRAQVRIQPDGRHRRMTVVSETPIGNLEAAVLTDRHGFPLPTTAFVCKNFAGELEEPDDTAYGDAYFPLTLTPGEKQARDFRVIHLTQNWGRFPLKQVSSIRFFNIYWHLSTGASETTCYTHDWMEIGRSQILHIPDFRPLSGPFWPGQPQHDCVQWPGFLQYNDREGRLVYERTEFASVSPSLARFTMYYHTSDDAVKAALTVTEMPQRDEMRTFITLRYDWVKPVAIRGDARAQFRWLNIFEKDTPAALHWLDASGQTRSAAVGTDGDAPMLLGEPLALTSPFAESQPGKPGGYSCVALIRSFRARLGGKEYDRPALSARFGAQDGSWWLTVPEADLNLQPGDFVEADVVLMPHGEAVPPGFKAARERAERFGAGIPRVTATRGEKLADFPARVRAKDEAAAVVLEGGFDLMTLTVEGFRDRGIPLLWRDGVWQNVQGPAGGDGYQVESDGMGGYRFTFAYPIRHGQKIPLLVTRADCTTGIAALRDENGALVIDAAGPSGGTFALQSPVLFAPGENRVAAGSTVVQFTGTARTVRQAAVRAEIKDGRATVAVDVDGHAVRVRGSAAALTFVHLSPGAPINVEVNGKTVSRTVARDGTLRVEARDGAVVRVRPLSAAAGLRSGAR